MKEISANEKLPISEYTNNQLSPNDPMEVT
jgi:hypothetical protein